jgi:hypothetical protein
MNILNFFEINSELLLFFSYFFVHTLVFYGLYKKYQYLQNEHENFFDDVETDKTAMSIENIETIKPFQKERVPYEEKYLIEVRNMKNEYVFTDEELETEQKMLRQLEEEENKVVSQSVMVLNEKIDELRMQLLELDENDESDENGESETIGKSQKDGTILKKIKTSLENEIKTHETKISELQESVSKNNEMIKEKARQYIINEQLKKFKNNFIIEYTPLGNVLLFYNYEKLAFEYYSDLTIPYRYLETVSRKYVLTYNYRPLYVDMEEELKEYERKLEEKEKTKSEPVVNNAKKQVFAKFKSYNTEAGTGRVNKVPPPKNSIPQNMLNLSKNIVKVDVNGKDNNGKMLLKENANRYSYQGKFCNFNFLKKIDRKNVDKKYTLTFADFKKMNKLENKN